VTQHKATKYFGANFYSEISWS